MATGTHFSKIVRVKIGVRVALWQDGVSGVAVSTAGNFFREAEPVILAVIAVKVRFYGNGRYIVLFHQFFICMAFHADFRMKHPLIMRAFYQRLYFVKVVAVMAGG
jgi:hypothetical protein